jgi:hypothetical protein
MVAGNNPFHPRNRFKDQPNLADLIPPEPKHQLPLDPPENVSSEFPQGHLPPVPEEEGVDSQEARQILAKAVEETVRALVDGLQKAEPEIHINDVQKAINLLNVMSQFLEDE